MDLTQRQSLKKQEANPMTRPGQRLSRLYDSATAPLLRHERRTLILLFLFALLLRLAYIGFSIGFDSPPEYDGIGYNQLAEGLLDGRGYVNYWGEPSAFRPPVYPIFLAGVYAVTGHSLAAVRLLQAVLDSVTVLLVYGIARRLFGGRVALLAGLGTALYPLLIYETGLIIPETLSYTLQFAAALCLIRMLKNDRAWPALATGALLALTVLARPTATLWAPLILAWVLLANGMRRKIVKLACLGIGLALVFAPWTARNYVMFRTIIPISSLGGTGMWTANNPWSAGGSVEPTAERWPGDDDPDRTWYGWSGISESESSRRFAQAGETWIRENPGRFLALAPRKILRTWSPASFSTQFGRQIPAWLLTAIGIPYGLFLLAVFRGIWAARRDWCAAFPLLAIILSVNLIVFIYSGATRYGIPMIVSFMPFAALALDRLGDPAPRAVSRRAAGI